MRYLDPKADLTFKKVFGEHPDLVISLLNALLPFGTPEEEIEEIEYLSPEQVPVTPLMRYTIVNVSCRDKRGRLFLVEIQVLWSIAFMQRVLFSDSKAYVRSLRSGREIKYDLLQPVYSLNLVNDIFLPDIPDAYHDYKIVQVEHTDKVIEGLRFIFVELPKFKPKDFKGKKMAVLWLRYLTEINEQIRQAPQDLLDNPEISKAVTQIEESAFSDAQLWWYDDFWDAVRVENTLISDALREGMEQGIQQGIQQGMQQGMQKGIEQGLQEGRQEGLEKGIQQGIRQGNIQNARGMKSEGIPVEIIAKITGLTRDEVEKL